MNVTGDDRNKGKQNACYAGDFARVPVTYCNNNYHNLL